jgi:hypothetical protein
MGIDPALAETLRRGEEAAAELAAIPDTPELKVADEAIGRPESNKGGDGARLGENCADGKQYRDGEHRLDLANASPAELPAFCLAVEMERGDEVSRSAGRDQPWSVPNALTGMVQTDCLSIARVGASRVSRADLGRNDPDLRRSLPAMRRCNDAVQ